MATAALGDRNLSYLNQFYSTCSYCFLRTNLSLCHPTRSFWVRSELGNLYDPTLQTNPVLTITHRVPWPCLGLNTYTTTRRLHICTEPKLADESLQPIDSKHVLSFCGGSRHFPGLTHKGRQKRGLPTKMNHSTFGCESSIKPNSFQCRFRGMCEGREIGT